MDLALTRVNSFPQDKDFGFMLNLWFASLVDTVNQAFDDVETKVNVTVAPSFTTAEITALAVSAPNGSLYYDTSTNELKAKVNGVVVVIV